MAVNDKSCAFPGTKYWEKVRVYVVNREFRASTMSNSVVITMTRHAATTHKTRWLKSSLQGSCQATVSLATRTTQLCSKRSLAPRVRWAPSRIGATFNRRAQAINCQLNSTSATLTRRGCISQTKTRELLHLRSHRQRLTPAVTVLTHLKVLTRTFKLHLTTCKTHRLSSMP